MRIVFVCNEYPPKPHAGIGTCVQAIARGLHGRGHCVSVVGLGDVKGETRDGGIPVISLRRNKLPFLGNLISRLRLRSWLYHHAKKEQIDIIEAPDYAGLLPFGVDGCRVVIRLHQTFTAVCLLNGQRASKGMSFYERRTLAANGNWIGVSHHILNVNRSIFGISPKRSVMIYNPAPPVPAQLPEVTNLPAEYIVSVGHVCERKGALVLARAFRALMTSHPRLHLVYVGGIFTEGGRLVSDQIRDIVGAPMAERVHFLGHVDRDTALACMAKAKLLAFPSRIEALGLVVLEAMSSGIPVVCTKNPPGPELIEDGVTGLLANPASVEDFSEKIAKVLEDDRLAARLVANSQDLVRDQFSLDRCVQETERFYDECLSRPAESVSKRQTSFQSA